MKEFLQTNKVTYNLMSFTAFKSMLLFSYLLEAPHSYEEIREHFAQHEYLNETISIDTLRVYIYSLERMGCEIIRGKKKDGSKYQLVKHPFELKLTETQVTNIIKVFKSIIKSIDIEELLSLTKFLKKMSKGIENEKLKEAFINLSPLSQIDSNILILLIRACRKNEEISIRYNSPRSGEKDIDVLAERLSISNNKVYLHGKSPQYKNTASFIVSNITRLPEIKIERTIKPDEEPLVIRCEIYNKDVALEDNEKIISEDDTKLEIEISSTNKFFAKQRVLYLGSDCKVLSPASFRDDIISTLKKMKEEYVTEKI